MEAGERAGDERAAQELREQVKAAGGSLQVPAAELAANFGRAELRGSDREAIARALGEAGVRSRPRLDRGDPDAEHVALFLRRARLSRPRGDSATPPWLPVLLGVMALGLGALGGVLVQNGGEDRATTTTIREPAESRGPGQTRTVTERDTVTERETVTTTVTTTREVTVAPPAPPPEAEP
jgi:hypothetical protein